MINIAKVLISVILMVVIFVGCITMQNQEPETTSGMENPKKREHIVFVTPLVASPVWVVAKEGFEDAAKDMDFRASWVGPPVFNTDEMIRQMEIAIAEKADGIITHGLDPEAMIPVLEKADAARIPVVVTNSDIPKAPRLAYIGTDPTKLGTLGAEGIIKKLNGKPPVVAAMAALLDYNIGIEMINAYKNKLSEEKGYKFITLTESNEDPIIAMERWQTIFNENPEVNVAICTTNIGSVAAAKVVEDMKLKDKIIIGIDQTQDVLDYIKKGTIYGTMTQNYYRKGYEASRWLIEYIREGKKPEKLINDSGTLLVTKENLDTYDKDLRNKETWK